MPKSVVRHDAELIGPACVGGLAALASITIRDRHSWTCNSYLGSLSCACSRPRHLGDPMHLLSVAYAACQLPPCPGLDFCSIAASNRCLLERTPFLSISNFRSIADRAACHHDDLHPSAWYVRLELVTLCSVATQPSRLNKMSPTYFQTPKYVVFAMCPCNLPRMGLSDQGQCIGRADPK